MNGRRMNRASAPTNANTSRSARRAAMARRTDAAEINTAPTPRSAARITATWRNTSRIADKRSSHVLSMTTSATPGEIPADSAISKSRSGESPSTNVGADGDRQRIVLKPIEDLDGLREDGLTAQLRECLLRRDQSHSRDIRLSTQPSEKTFGTDESTPGSKYTENPGRPCHSPAARDRFTSSM